MTTFEAELAHELRSLPTAAPAGLRERVRALGEPEPRRTFPAFGWRRAALVLVPACLAAVVSAAAIDGLLSSRASHQDSSREFAKLNQHGATGSGSVNSLPSRSALSPSAPVHGSTPLGIPTPSTTRHQDYQADLRVRVDDLESLGRKTAQAMQVTRGLGGYVASVSQSSERGEPGEADLVLRVPVSSVEDAMIQLSALGTVLEQHVSIVDLENTVRQQRQHVRALQLQIVRLTAALRQSLPADVRLRLQFQLDDARRNVRAATGARKAALREAALSRISLALTTEHAAATATHHRGRFGNAVSAAVGFLEGAGAIALTALIVLAPLALIVALVLWGVRTVRRRTADRVLAAS